MNGDRTITATFILDQTTPPQSEGNASFIPAVMAASAGSSTPPLNATPTYTPTPSPTPTATASATPAATFTPTATTPPFKGAISNGDFESGPTSWYEYSAQVAALIIHESSLPIIPISGSWAAWLGGLDDEYSYVEQTLTLHPSTTRLNFAGHPASQETTCGYDYAFVEIDNGYTYDYWGFELCEATNTGWVGF